MKAYRFLRVASVILLSIIAVYICRYTFSFKAEYPIMDLDKGWTVTINSKTYEDVDITRLYEVLDSKLARDDRVSMWTTLPDDGDIPFPVIQIKTRYSTLSCYLDDILIYENGLMAYANDEFLGKRYHFISLPSDYAGKTVRFDMYVSEKNAFNSFESIKVGSQPDVEGQLTHSNIQIIITGFFMLAFGLAFLCITLFFITAVHEVVTLLIGSLFCIFMGTYILCYYNVLSMFMDAPHETLIEYMTLYTMVPFCYIMLYLMQHVENKKLYLIVASIGCLIPVMQYILHFAFGIHLKVTLPVYHVDGLVGFGLVLYYAQKNFRKRDIPNGDMIQMAGLLAFTACATIHLGIYVLGSMHIQIYLPLAKGIISLGCLYFATCQLANYLVNITEAYATKKENMSLTHLAYADGLTNLANRAKSDSFLESLNDSEDDYCIISIDLNGLKAVNDKFGHIAGDRYITDFAKVLGNTFGDDTFKARIGGDEFLVIIRDSSVVDVSALIERMNSALNVMNALYPDYHRSVATGYAYRHECEGKGSHEVYLLADQRMYELKRKMHEDLGIHTRL
ncbi:GGDEF domain-containing protein [Butyrivibrio sp. MC2021]|uniref:GGDEF domain-containing protein n=1 Tax=Butyrivibrio sp. MC2021 TaxID=1408306 RepID=UPI00047BE1B0|nr:GGDEF domain-containing protein [Butyrivibrio sp. MC2021]